MENILSIQIDSYGEFIHKPFTETLKAITSEIMSEYRSSNHFLGERSDYWVKELSYRQAEN